MDPLAGGSAAPPTRQEAPYSAEEVMPEPLPEGKVRLPSGVGLPTAKAVVDLWDRSAWPVAHGPIRHRDGDWFEWSGGVYREVPKQRVRDNIYRLVDRAVYWKDGNSQDAGEWVPWGAVRPRVNDVLDAIATAAGLPHDLVSGSMLDGSPALPVINVLNGLLDPATWSLYPHNPLLFSTTQLPIVLDPTAPPRPPLRWLHFLHEVFEGDQESILVVQQWFAYLLTGRTSLQKALYLRGQPRSGKGTILRVAEALVGRANCAAPTVDSYASNFGLQELVDKTLATTGDVRFEHGGQKRFVERVLSITGEDSLMVDRKNKTHWTGRLGARLMFASNDAPAVVDSSGAFASRLILLETRGSWLGREDHTLGEALMAELDGVMWWALNQWGHIASGGRIAEPASSGALRNEADALGSSESAFLTECCEVGAGHEDDLALIYAVYLGWRRTQGQAAVQAKHKRRFAADLRGRLNGRPARKSNGGYVQPGVRITDDLPVDVRRSASDQLDLASPLRKDPRLATPGGFGALAVVR